MHGAADEHHFFVKRRHDGRDWVYWREGRLLWLTLLEVEPEKKTPAEATARAVWRRQLHTPEGHSPEALARDSGPLSVAPPLAPQAQVAEIVYDCVVHGEMVEVQRSGARVRA